VGLRAKGARVTTVTAYRTVDYPADQALRLDPPEADSGGQDAESPFAFLGDPKEVRRRLEEGSIDAVVAASPSAAKRIAHNFPPVGRGRFVAVGPSTAAAATGLGITVAATAGKPTPDGVLAALSQLFATEGT